METSLLITMDYSPFERKIQALVDKLRSQNTATLGFPAAESVSSDVPDRTARSLGKTARPKLRKQLSVDLNTSKDEMITGLQDEAVKSKTGWAKGKVRGLIDRYEQKINKLPEFFKKKIIGKVIDKKNSKMSSLRKENKMRTFKQVKAFLNESVNKPAVIVNIFDLSNVDSIRHHAAPASIKKPFVINHKIKSHSVKKASHIKTPFESSITTPKFVRFNETNTLKPYGSTSTASTIASLCSSVIMSSNSIKSFKTANSTFDPLETPTNHRKLNITYQLKPKVNGTVTIVSKRGYKSSKNLPPLIAPRIDITSASTSLEEEVQSASPPRTTENHSRSRRPTMRRYSSSDQNYSIGNLNEDDETDDEDDPRKPIPQWAQPDVLTKTARKLAMSFINNTKLFKASADTSQIQLEKVFPIVKKTFHGRSSSAEWLTPSVRQAGY